jgi:hypothetical protein
MKAIAFLCVCLFAAIPIQAAVFLVTTAADSGPGSLRQAILDSNATTTRNEIHFSIAPGGVQVIPVLSGLPVITTPVQILGITQPGFVGTPLIQLDGMMAGPANGLWFQTSNSVVQSLSITRFQPLVGSSQFGYGILCEGFGNHVIVGNYIGVDTTGAGAGNGNRVTGIFLSDSHNNMIGGTDPAYRNVVSDNAHPGLDPINSGIVIQGTNNTVQGNFIGTDATGLTALGNRGFAGVQIGGDNNLIGGPDPGAGNVISDNRTNAGVEIDAKGDHSPSLNNVIQGNLIGTDATGMGALPNYNWGILVNSGGHTQIGGYSGSSSNVIAYNNWDGIGLLPKAFSGVDSTNHIIQGNFIHHNGYSGIYVDNTQSPTVNNFSLIGGSSSPAEFNQIISNGSNGVTILHGIGYAMLGNTICNNGALGIDLGGDGLTLNDPCDTDTGPNNLQNFPILDSAYSDGFRLSISGHLNSEPNSTYRLEFFLVCHCIPGNPPIGDGIFIGTGGVTTDGRCNGNFAVTLPARVPPGNRVAATATSPHKDTSEFSFCWLVQSPPMMSAAVSGDGHIYLSWSTNLVGWQLQNSPGLNPPNWQDDPSLVFVLNGQNTVKEAISTNTFYRLRSP